MTVACSSNLIPAAASHAEGRYMVQSPFSDYTTFQWKGGQWTVDPLHNSLITAGNGGTTPAKVAFYLYTKDGKTRYEFPQRTLAPGEQMWVDVGQVIRNRAGDAGVIASACGTQPAMSLPRVCLFLRPATGTAR